MPRLLWARAFAHGVSRKLGIDVMRWRGPRNPLYLRGLLVAHCRPTVVLDVGANEGQYARDLRVLGYTGRIVSFEPLARPFQKLERRAQADPQWEVVQVALGENPGLATMNVSANVYSSSLLPALARGTAVAPGSRMQGTEEVRVRTLSEMWPDHVEAADRVFLKIDAQGYESNIIDGAKDRLDSLVGAQLELSLQPLYEGQQLFLELVMRMRDHGFDLAGLEPGLCDLDTGEMLQVDGIFLRTMVPGS